MENSTEIPSKTKNRVTIWSYNPTPGHTSGKDESSNSKKYMHPNIHSSMIYNSQDMGATEVSISRWMDKEGVYIHTREHSQTLKKNKIMPLVAT